MFQAIRLTNIWGEPVPILTFVAVVSCHSNPLVIRCVKKIDRPPARPQGNVRLAGKSVPTGGVYDG